jgi:hypothetical protein
MDTHEWEEPHDPDARPAEVTLAVKLLAGSIAFGAIKTVELWSRLGMEWVAANRAAWIRPATLTASAAAVALTLKGFSWARTLVLAAIAWDIMQLLSAASLLFAIGGSRLLGILSWANVAVELYAAYLLLQEESLDWFRRQGD